MKLLGVSALILGLVSATDGVKAVAVPPTWTTTLRKEASKRNILIGSGATNPNYLDDPQFATVLGKQFNSLSPENELKWEFLHPTPDHYNWHTIDRLVEFAEKHDMAVKGHGLISGSFNPSYLTNVTDPVKFRAIIESHFQSILRRYDGKIDRWDVVTEVMETQGVKLAVNDFYKVLGPEYIGEVFRIARAAAPNAKLFFNENLVETLPDKRKALYNIIAKLVADGAPINGVALQMHITEIAPIPGVITDIVKSYKALGLEVSIAEMDVHTYDVNFQNKAYYDIIYEALKAGITEISFWGFTDKHLYTWLPGAKPLMFDETYHPKGAFYAAHRALAKFVGSA